MKEFKIDLEPKVLTNEGIEKELLITLQKIEFFSNNLLHLNRKKIELKYLIDKEKFKIMYEVSKEEIKLENSLPKKKYTNENARNAETMRRLTEIPIVKDWNKNLEENNEELEETKLEVEKEDRMYKALKAICYLRGSYKL